MTSSQPELLEITASYANRHTCAFISSTQDSSGTSLCSRPCWPNISLYSVGPTSASFGLTGKKSSTGPPSTLMVYGRCSLKGIEGSNQRIGRSGEHTSELQSLMRISYAVFCLKKKKN